MRLVGAKWTAPCKKDGLDSGLYDIQQQMRRSVRRVFLDYWKNLNWATGLPS
jgi:hypothetical protein